VHKEIKSKKSVGVHWGTFPLGWEHWCAARDDLKDAALKHGLKDDEFITVGHGDSFDIDY
jgi:N-acyl-phosphatidylethanolamine-hydrolysing phospholipase D